MTDVKENIEMMNEMGTTGYDSLRALADLNLVTWNKLMEKQMETLTTVMETSMAQVKMMTEAKDYHAAFKGQMDLGRELGETLMGKTRETMELAQQAGVDYRAWAEENMATAKEQVAKAAEKAA